MRKVLTSFLLVLALLAAAIWYAYGPALSPAKFPPQAVVEFPWAATQRVPDAKEIKILSYNIGYGSGAKNNENDPLSEAELRGNLEAMAKALSAQNADILALQEVDFQASRSFDINQFEYLAKVLQMPYGAYVVTWNKRYLPWPYWPPRAQFGRIVSGQAVLSRFPIAAQETVLFAKPAENDFWYNWFYLDRILQKLTLKWGTHGAIFWNVHLEAFHPGTRLRQAEILASLIAQDRTPYQWAAGDFNSVSKLKEPLTAVQKAQLEDSGEPLAKLMQVTGMKNAEAASAYFSFPSWDPYKKIDQIFYAPPILFLSGGNLYPLTASDHLPVWASFKIP